MNHGNLKPQNILLNSSIEVKLSDFFLPELIEINGGILEPSEPVILNYCAPEVLSSTPFVPFGHDAASDVYSFGLILMEMVSGGIRPMKNFSNSQIRILVGFAKFREIGKIRNFNLIIKNCLKNFPSKRINFEQILVQLNSLKINSAPEDALITFISGRSV